jgi:TatD DNase family protein
MRFNYIDAHAHPNFAAFGKDRDEVIRRALEAGVLVNVVGTQKDTSRAAVEFAEKYDLPAATGAAQAGGVYATVGLHPIHTGKSFHDKEELGESLDDARDSGGFTSRGEVFDYEYYKKLAAHPKVVAIGECGLDYYRYNANTANGGNANTANKKQEEAFRKQIELAKEVEKPLMLHLRNGSGRSAYNDAFSILSTYNFQLATGRRPGNLHFFAGSIEEAKPFLDSGFTFSFTGVITFARNYDEIIRYLPLDRILSETDCPYAAPAPYRGKRNEPLYVTEVVKAIARIRNEDEEKVRMHILKNAKEFFGLVN